MRVMFIGANHEVTGSCTLIEACGKKILVDCGMEQGPDIYENCELPVVPGEIDAVCLTHAHIDHSGKIPNMVANGFSGKIHMTEATGKLCSIMLRDSAHIQEFEAQWRNRKAKRSGEDQYTPLYTPEDVEKTVRLFVTHNYEDTVRLFDGIKISFFDAGHLLGSSNILFEITEDGVTKTILFSGDVGNLNRPLIKNPQTPPHADYVVCESTYGDRTHGAAPDYVGQLAQVIDETLSGGGNLVIPAFAVGRTQELLYLIRVIKEKNLCPDCGNFPVYVDSPLAIEATNIYSSEVAEYFDDETVSLLEKGINPISFPNLRVAISSEESTAINNNPEPKVIISASGMCEAGRIRHHLKHNLWRRECAVLFCGFQCEGTLGRRLIDGAAMVKLFGDNITVRARIYNLNGFSGHADRNMLLQWLREVDAKQIFINHGEDAVSTEFALTCESELNTPAIAPYSGDVYDLASGECIEKARIVRAEGKKDFATKRAKDVFDRLLSAVARLKRVTESLKGSSNKELAKFTDQINNLCDKYEK
ncbi:MAG: MBL fold metallo-hydrolase [Clostridia bacterium]|nr:MBL fold metallo-hydrolase [Clostridia bacterium]